MRILPGIMPVLSIPRLRRVLELTGELAPPSLVAALERADSPAAAAAAGIDASTTLARHLLDGGASGLHLYTFNRSEAPLAVLGGAGLLDSTRKGIPA
jgi:methylenetetrahydrofolate reductase (NADPH)